MSYARQFDCATATDLSYHLPPNCRMSAGGCVNSAVAARNSVAHLPFLIATVPLPLHPSQYRTGYSEDRRARRLVISFIMTAVNYEYCFCERLGTVDHRLTGTAFASCSCSHLARYVWACTAGRDAPSLCCSVAPSLSDPAPLLPFLHLPFLGLSCPGLVVSSLQTGTCIR
jgi:hypothetical protein